MFWRRNISKAISIYRNYLVPHNSLRQNCVNIKKYGSIASNHRQSSQLFKLEKKSYNTSCVCSIFRHCSTKGSLDDKAGLLKKEYDDKELKKIIELFPQPRVTLNEFMAKMPDKIFDIHYKQNFTIMAPKKARKKTVHNDWTCVYAFVWPETIKFTGTAVSKRQAAEKAAMQALKYLYENKRINYQGQPIFKKEVLDELREKIDEPIHVSIGEKSIERIEKLWSEYEDGIKNIYEATFDEAQSSIALPGTVTKDSTIDEEDEYSDNEAVENVVQESNDPKVHPVYGRYIPPPTMTDILKRHRTLQAKFEKYKDNIVPLPMDNYVQEIQKSLDHNRVAIIVGAAGCGKSTRVPASILKFCGAGTAAIVSEPRRIAAIGLAQTVARDLGEDVGESIGYQVRLQSKLPRPPVGSVLFCTSGVLLRRLQTNPGLEGCSHVIIDEAHERDVNTDVTMLLLKRALTINDKLRVLIMSATLDIDVFTNYFDSCPVLQVPGRAYPVTEMHLEDIQSKFGISLPAAVESSQKMDGRPNISCEEVVEVIKAVDKSHPEGAILVFLPGWAEIKQTKRLLDAVFDGYLILPVHSRLSTTDQTKIFDRPTPGVRKIVLATNIAETSVTIPDVTVVIDTGAHRENRVKEGTGTASLETVWVSQAGAKQRAGRAGRMQPGHCYKLYTKERESEFIQHNTPEILRTPLEQTVLDCKSYSPDDKVEDFLSQLPEPPSRKAIKFAVDDLIDLGALTPTENLTRLGSLLCQLTVHPRLGAVLLHGAIAGAVVSTANVTTHCADNVEVFEHAADRREEIREIKRKYSNTSDHVALHWIQETYQKERESRGNTEIDEWCNREGLRKDRLGYVSSITKMHIEQVLQTGIFESTIEPIDLNRFSDNDELTTALLLSGTNALLKTKRRVKTKGKLATTTELVASNGDRAHISSESVNHGITKDKTNSLLTYFGGYHSTERRALVVYKTSLIPPHTALLFCKGKIDALYISSPNSSEDTTLLSLPKHKLQIHVPTSQAKTILNAREMLWNTLQYYIERNIKKLDYDENVKVSRFKVRLMKALAIVLVESKEVIYS